MDPIEMYSEFFSGDADDDDNDIVITLSVLVASLLIKKNRS